MKETCNVILSAVLVLFAPVAAGAVNSGQPFMDGATISIDNTMPTPVTLPSGPGVAATDYVGGGGAAGSLECGEQTCPPLPVPESISNWNTFYHTEFGIEIDNGWRNFRFGSPSAPATIDDVLRHVRDTFATVNAVFKRDVGAVLQIKHVRVLDQVAYAFDDESFAYWENNLPTVDFVYRLIIAQGSGGARALSCGV